MILLLTFVHHTRLGASRLLSIDSVIRLITHDKHRSTCIRQKGSPIDAPGSSRPAHTPTHILEIVSQGFVVVGRVVRTSRDVPCWKQKLRTPASIYRHVMSILNSCEGTVTTAEVTLRPCWNALPPGSSCPPAAVPWMQKDGCAS